MQRPTLPMSNKVSSRRLKDQLKAELEASTHDYNLKVAKYRLASLIEFCECNEIDFDDVLDELDVI